MIKYKYVDVKVAVNDYSYVFTVVSALHPQNTNSIVQRIDHLETAKY